MDLWPYYYELKALFGAQSPGVKLFLLLLVVFGIGYLKAAWAILVARGVYKKVTEEE